LRPSVICAQLAPNAPVKVNPAPPPPTPGHKWGLVLDSLQKLTKPPLCGGNFVKQKGENAPTPEATKCVNFEFAFAGFHAHRAAEFIIMSICCIKSLISHPVTQILSNNIKGSHRF